MSELVVSQSTENCFLTKTCFRLVATRPRVAAESVAASSFDDHISASHNKFKCVILVLLLMQK